MIISWLCFIKAVHDYCKYVSSPPAPPRIVPVPPVIVSAPPVIISVPPVIVPAFPGIVPAPVPLVHIKNPPIRPDRPFRTPVVEVTCLLPICQEYLQSLKLDRYFEEQSDCFCIKCRSNTSRKTFGGGSYEYTIPYGWVRFRIKVEKLFTQDKQVFRKWATSYYGTWEENLERILRNRVFPFPKDALLDGKPFLDHSQDGEHCFTSPSINYTSDWQRSPPRKFTLSNGSVYDAQIILQCKQKPKTFIIQSGTPGICDIISADVIEWKSKQRSTIIPHGVMIKMMKR
jgi:hypothetical protein